MVAAGLFAIAGSLLVAVGAIAKSMNQNYPPDPLITFGGVLLLALSVVLLVAGFIRRRW
jgi:hypothetical protein